MSAAKNDAVMTIREVSIFLKLSESTIYRLAQEGKLPGRKFGGNWRFSRDELHEWLRQPSSEQQSHEQTSS